MTSISRRRLSRLENLASAVVAERKRREPEVAAWRRQAARDHATKLVALVLHGDPRIDEPLAIAWHRAVSKLGLANVDPALLRYRLANVVAALPGDTENAKFAHVFGSAPRWLLYFCMAAIDSFILGFDYPKNLEWEPPDIGRDGSREANHAWPGLPQGTIGAGRPIGKLNPLRALSPEENIDLLNLNEKGEENWLRQDRRRWREIWAKIDEDEWLRAAHEDIELGKAWDAPPAQ
jgi:hypothetical protein